jgi:hypothetical protein
MKKSTLWLSVLFVFIGACQKEIIKTDKISATNTIDAKNLGIDTSGWYGSYFDPMGDPDDTVLAHHYIKVPDDTLILNGVAQVPNGTYSNFSDTTEIIFDMPGNHTINTDSSSFDVTVRKSSNNIELNILGASNSAKLTYKANSLNDSGYYLISVGSTSAQFSVYPATDFTSFKLLRFAFRQNSAYVYVTNKFNTSFKYDV